ncbi:MAG: PaaI family thioesterase [Alphaproteobacteria bacterium]
MTFNTPSNIGLFNAELGIEIDEWRDGFVKISMSAAPRHMNRSGFLHGGVVTSLLDVAGGYAGCWCSVEGNVRRAVTISLNTNFLRSGGVGELIAIGKVVGGGKKIFFCQMDVFNKSGDKIAFGTANYKYLRGSEAIEGVEP